MKIWESRQSLEKENELLKFRLARISLCLDRMNDNPCKIRRCVDCVYDGINEISHCLNYTYEDMSEIKREEFLLFCK